MHKLEIWNLTGKNLQRVHFTRTFWGNKRGDKQEESQTQCNSGRDFIRDPQPLKGERQGNRKPGGKEPPGGTKQQRSQGEKKTHQP